MSVIVNIQMMQDKIWGSHTDFDQLNKRSEESLRKTQDELIVEYNKTVQDEKVLTNNMKVDNLPSPLRERVKNGAAQLLTSDGYGTLIGTVGVVTGGAYKGLKARLLYCVRDGDTFSQTIELLEGKDKGVHMCYLIGDKKLLK